MKKLHVTIILIAFLLLIATVLWGMLRYYTEQNTVPEGTTAGGISVGGLTVEDAVKQVEEYVQLLELRTVAVEANEKTADRMEWTAKEIGYSVEVIGLKEALQKLHQGNLLEQAKYRYRFPRTYELKQSFDRAKFEKLVRKQWDWIDNNDPQDATRTITNKDEIVYVPHVDAYRINPAPLVDKIEPWLILSGAEIGGRPEQSVTESLPIDIVHPKVTLEQLKAEGIDRKIFEFTTDFNSSAEGRAHNVTAAANALNDWHLAPGEVFSYGDVIKLAGKEYGFREAPVIQNGKLVPGIGGGICQVSSTLYNVVLRTGIEVVERRNHSLPVAYLPKGQDATFATGSIDFRFRNSTGKHLIIRTSVDNQKLTVKMFGTMPENIRYDIESKTVKEIAPSIQYVTDKSLKSGARVVVQNGRSGSVVETYRTLVKDGKAVSRERVSRDTYRAQPTIIHVGPGTNAPSSTPKPKTDVVEDGIG
ncbi:VanW family protein [Paenibacillus sp. NPDC058071]|uniref:VanW family protein n=1 Tax=Paenibacillus sp. NPDC058071 TaxID=3346326 RepID=UPI0036DDB795